MLASFDAAQDASMGAFGRGLYDIYAVNGKTPPFIGAFADGVYVANNQPTTLAGATTFARSGNATMFDSDGALKWAPHNSLTYSQQFDNAAWIKGAVTVTANSIAAPDNTATADRIEVDGATAAHYTNLTSFIAPPSSTIRHAFRVWLQPDEYQYAVLSSSGGTGTGRYAYAVFNLSGAGSVTATGAGASGVHISSQVVSVVDGWYLCELVATDANGMGFQLSPSLTATPSVTSFGRFSEASTVGDGFYAWGAHTYRSDLGGMVNNPATNDSYVPTVASPVYLPREGSHLYEGGAWVNNGLQLESEARTNLATYSNALTSGNWTVRGVNSVTVTAGQATGPDGTASLSKVAITDTATEDHGLMVVTTLVAGTTYTMSATVQNIDQNYVALWLWGDTDNWVTATFNLLTGVMTSGQTGATSGTLVGTTINDIGGGRYFISMSASVGSVASIEMMGLQLVNAAVPTLDTSGRSAYSGVPGVGFYAGFTQLELGSTPSSYIPTAGSTVTRAAETLTASAANLPWPTPVETTGIELVTNGDFATNDLTGFTNQSNGTGTVNASTGAAVITSTNSSNRGKFSWIGSAVPLAPLRIEFTITNTTFVAGANLGGFANANYSVGTHILFATATSSAPSISFQRAGDNGTTTIDNITVKEINPLAVSIQISGKMNYADKGQSFQEKIINWAKDGSNYVDYNINTNSILTGQLQVRQQSLGVNSQRFTSSGYYTPSVNEPFNIASRHGSTFLGVAADGTLLAPSVSAVSLPDLESTDLEIAPIFMGHVHLVRVWAVDIGDTGIGVAST
jgi:hypothetical protein